MARQTNERAERAKRFTVLDYQDYTIRCTKCRKTMAREFFDDFHEPECWFGEKRQLPPPGGVFVSDKKSEGASVNGSLFPLTDMCRCGHARGFHSQQAETMELRSAQSMRSERVVTGYRYPCNNCGCKEFDFLRQSQDPLLAKYFGADPAAGPDQTVVWSNKPGVADTFKLADLKKAFATLGLDPDKAASTQSYSAIGLDRSAVVQQWQETSYSYDGETWVSADAARSDLDFKYMRFVRTTQEATARVLDVVAEIYENQGGRWALVDRSQQMVAEGDLLPTRSRLSDWRMISGTAAKPKPTFVEPPKGRRFGDEND